MSDPKPFVRDPERLAEVRGTGLLDTGPEEVFDRLTRLAARVIGAPVSFISLVDEDRDFYKSLHGLDEPLASDREIRGPTLCHHALRSPEPLVIPDTRADPVYCRVPTVESLGVAAYLGIPLVTSRGRAIGSFCAVAFEPREWRRDDVEALREFAASAMREIELRREVAERRRAEQEVRSHSRALALGAEVGAALIEPGPLPRLLQRCVEAMVRNLDAAFAQVWTLDEAEGVLELQAGAGTGGAPGGDGRVRVGEGEVGRVAAERTAYLTRDARQDPRVGHREWARQGEVVSFAGYPLLAEGRLVGVLALAAGHPLTEGDGAALQAISDQVALAVHQKWTEADRERLLRESQDARRRISTILESITDAFFALDREWRFTYLNRGAREVVSALLQRPPGEALGLSFWEVVPQFRGTRFEEEYRRAVDTRVPAHFEEFAPAFGVWFDVNAYPSPDGLSVYFRDVTERHRTEEALRHSEEMLRQIAENIREVFWVSDPAYSRMYYVSPAYHALWGRGPEELYRDPMTFLDSVHPDDRARVAAAIPDMATGDYDVQYRIVRPDGTLRWHWARSSPVRDERGEIYRSVGMVEDITPLKEAEEEQARLLARERQARDEAERRAVEEAALRAAAAAVTATFTVEEASRRIAESALEATRADGAFVERIDVDRWEIVVAALAGERTPALGSRMPYAGSLTERAVESKCPQLAGPDAGGSTAPGGELDHLAGASSVLVIPLLDAGEPIGTLVLVRGAERGPFRQDEVERARTFGDLAALAFRKIHLLEDSEKRREEVERVTESRARLVRGFSHDLKNPLGAADGHAQLLQDGILGALAERQLESIGRIRASIRSALELINDLVELARAEAGQLELEPRPTDVREVARELGEDYRAQAESAGLRFLTELPDEFPVIRSDPTRVRQVLGNLISNAIKYNRPMGTVTVRAALRTGREDGEYAVVEVADTGIGIPEDKLRLLFQEFSRLAPGSAHGAGLGLAISQKIAGALGGEITVETAPEVGSTFTLWLPADGAGGD